MSEKKVVGRNLAIVLGVICIILAVGLVANLQNQVNNLKSAIASLNSQLAEKDSQIQQIQVQLSNLNASYIWLKQHSFIYYTVGNDINISNVGIYRVLEWLNLYTINGTITNISNKPIKTVYVYLILRNPDDTADFSPYRYDIIENLYIGETAPFEFSGIYYKEGQTIEIFLVY